MKKILLMLGLSCPVLLHMAVAEHSRIFLGLALGVAALFVFLAVHRRVPLPVAIALAAAVEAPAWLGQDTGMVVALAWPLLTFAGLGWVFGRTLVAGSQPMVERIARLERGAEMPAELVGYARVVTWAWTLLFVAMGVVSIGLALAGLWFAWSMFTNVISYFLIGGLFIGEYVYRVVRYSNYHHQNPVQVFRKLLRAPEVFR